MDQPLKERRQAARFGQSVVSSIKAVLRPGLIVSLVDLSTGGARVQGSRPLRPGSQVHLLLEVEDRLFGIGARVLRCSVAALDSSSGVQYWGALQFERCCRIWEEATLDGKELPVDNGEAGHLLPGEPIDESASHTGDRL